MHVEFAAVARPSWIARLTGKNVRGFKYSVSNQAIRHTLKNHGNAKVEAARGQLAVTPDDFRQLPAIVRTGALRSAGPHRSPHQRVVVTNEIEGLGYYAVFEVKTGKERLELWTMRKKVGAWR